MIGVGGFNNMITDGRCHTLSSTTVIFSGVSSRPDRLSRAQWERNCCATEADARAACLAGVRPADAAEAAVAVEADALCTLPAGVDMAAAEGSDADFNG